MTATRRTFMTSAAALAATGLAPASPEAALPAIRLGKYEVSRLVLGSNPLAGASHFNGILDQLMREWMTPEKVMEILHRCEQAGYRAWQLHTDAKLLDCLKQYKAEGGKMHAFSLSDFKDPKGSIADLAKAGVIGVVHHGERTDVNLREGKMDDIKEFITAVHDAGLLAGVSMHNPACLDLIEGKGWPVDFYMTCVYRRSRLPEETRAEFNEATVGEPYFEKDPERMCKMVRQAKKPCFAFKILAAGRNIKSPQAIDGAFKFVYQNIKPTDGVIIGMFPRFKDEIKQNAELARKYGVVKA
jgi:hypothetical protein